MFWPRITRLVGVLFTVSAIVPTAAAGASFSETELDAITQHAFRGGASYGIPGVTCGAQCASLWAAEQTPVAAADWVRELHRELFMLRQRTKLFPPNDKFGNIPVSASKPVLKWRVGSFWGARQKLISVEAPPPSVGGIGPISAAYMIPSFNVEASGGIGNTAWALRSPVLGFRGLVGINPAGKQIVDFNSGHYGNPWCAESYAPGMNYPAWEMLRGPTRRTSTDCGGMYWHHEVAFHRLDPLTVDGTIRGIAEDYAGQPVTEPEIPSWNGVPDNGAILRSRVVSEIQTQWKFYPVLIAWYEHQLQGGPLPDEDEWLARKFRPVLRFDRDEKWRPLNVEDFFAERDSAGLGLHRACIPLASPDADWITPGHSETEPDNEDFVSPAGVIVHHCARLTSVDDLTDWASADAFLDLQQKGGDETADDFASPRGCAPAPLLDCDTSHSTSYYSIGDPTSNGYRLIVYWYLYRFNDFGGNFQHEGDWEGVEVAPSTLHADTFDYVSFSGHGTWYSYLRQNIECDDGVSDASCTADGVPVGSRVRVYVAAGSHANYPQPCFADGGFCSQAGSLPEQRYDGAWNWGLNYDHDGSGLRSVSAVWNDWPGRWGISGSPLSPGLQPPSYDNFECADGNGPEDVGPGCPARPARARRRAPVTQAQRNRRAARCANWFGPNVVAALCTPGLRSAVKARRLGRPGRIRVRVLRKLTTARAKRVRASSASVTSLTQTLGAPLRVGDRVRVTGGIPAGSVLLVRGERGGRPVTARLHIRSTKQRLVVELRRAPGGARFSRLR